MKRRNFFALLLAPFVARFLPKAKPKPTETLWWLGNDFKFSIAPGSLDEINRISRELMMLQIRTYYTKDRIKVLGPEGITVADFENPHQQIPFVVVPPLEKPWENNA